MSISFEGPGFSPQGMSRAHDGNLAIVMSGRDAIEIADIESGRRLASIPTAGGLNTGVTWVDSQARYLFSEDVSGSDDDTLFEVKPGGSAAPVELDAHVWQGYPLASGDGLLFRGGRYGSLTDWTSLRQIDVAPASNPREVLYTLQPDLRFGIGDMAWDGAALWLLHYLTDPAPGGQEIGLYRVDPLNGDILWEYDGFAVSGAHQVPSGLAFVDGALFVFNWGGGQTSSIMELSLKGCR